MPGGRPINGRDVHAALAAFAPGRGDPDAARAAVAPDDAFEDYEALARALPPARAGLTPGEHAALFAPLFGEFE
jgi:hypothetical protein